MKPPSFIPRNDSHVSDAEQWIRAVQAILSGQWTIGDQALGEVKSFQWVADNSPANVATKSTQRPLAVLGLATKDSTGAVVSGHAVSWSWQPSSTGGVVEVTAVGDTTGSDEYTVTVWIVGG